MSKNKLMIAAAGSGKTTFLVNQANQIKDETVLITTYTEANEAEIKRKLISLNGYIPKNIKVQTWFSFLLQHGIRPYQSVLEHNLHNKSIGFYLTSKPSGVRYRNRGRPVCWAEKKNFRKHYFTDDLKIYSDKASKFIIRCNKKSKGKVIERIAKIFDHIFIDEVQDLAGHDLEILKLLFKAPISVLLVGDPRQVTYLTHNSRKHKKYSQGRIQQFIQEKLGKRIKCLVDDQTLKFSHRNNQLICDYSAKLYPSLPKTLACKCETCRSGSTQHEGIFVVRSEEVESYISFYKPMQLRWDTRVNTSKNAPVMNFGQSKGLSFDRVLIYPTEKMKKWVRNNKVKLSDSTRAKFYVGITRAKHSVAIILDYEERDSFADITKYRPNE